MRAVSQLRFRRDPSHHQVVALIAVVLLAGLLLALVASQLGGRPDLSPDSLLLGPFRWVPTEGRLA